MIFYNLIYIKYRCVRCLLFLCLPTFCWSQFCPVEEYDYKTTITWSAEQPGEVVSKPPCINHKYELTKRTCTSNGTWLPEETIRCKLTQGPTVLKCPPEYIGFGNYCLYIKHSQTGNAKCPLPNYLDVTEQKYLMVLHVFNLNNIWLPVKRNQPYGKFIYTHQKYLNRLYYHKKFEKIYAIENFISDCVILKTISVHKNDLSYEPEIVNCSALHTQVCLYETKDTISISNNNISCPVSDQNFCYLILNKTEQFCNKLAEPDTAIENIIIKNLIQDQKCYFGLKRNNDDVFHWPKSNSFLDYTDWLLDTDFNNSVSVVTKNGWTLEDSDDDDCQICEKNIKNDQTRLTLKVNYKKGLVLTLYSPEYFINENKVSCSVVGVDDINIKFDVSRIKKHKYDHDKILSHLSERDNREVYLLKPNTKEYNYYKCEGVVLPNATLISTGYVLYGTKKHVEREYSIDILVENFCLPPLQCETIWDANVINAIKNMNLDRIDNVRLMKILKIKNDSIRLILHVRLKKNHLSLNVEYDRLYDLLNSKFYKLKNIRLISLKYIWGCLEDVTKNGNMDLHWDFTSFGTTIMPKELCLDSEGIPITRKCNGDFISGGEWSKESGICSQYIFHSPTTKILHDLYSKSKTNPDGILKTLRDITNRHPDYIPSDIYYISKIIQNLNPEFNVVPKDVIQIFSNLISVDLNVLKSSSKLLNSTNILLDTFDSLMKQTVHPDLEQKAYVQYIAPNIFYQISDISDNITGVVMLNISKNINFTDCVFQPLKSDEEMEHLLHDPYLEVATFIPQYAIEDVSNRTGLNSTKLFISIFSSNSLFVQDSDAVNNKIIGVSFMGDENSLSSPIPVVFRNDDKHDEKRCSYWSFGGSAYESVYPPGWATDGGIRWNSFGYEICGFTHLTHFGLLLMNPVVLNDTVQIKDYEVHYNYLSVITIVGCSLSIVGISIIILTTVRFESWRNQIGTKVLLNFSCSTLMQMIVFFLADRKNFGKTNCVIVGVVLHYSVVSSFCWMLVVAFLQYLRFVKIIGGPPSHLLLKSCFVGWVLPLIPVVCLLVSSSNSYSPMGGMTDSGLCYPHGNIVYTTVLLPILIIVMINLVIFCLILFNVTRKTLPKRNKNKNLLVHQLKLAVLLFFLLGLTWIFGILAVTQKCLVCIYLFCSTATLQGFVLFVFYVVLDRTTRKLWASLLFPKSTSDVSGHRLKDNCDTGASSNTQNSKF